MSYCTPFQKVPTVLAHMKHVAALLGKRANNLSYRMDFWDRENGG